LEFPT
jgi:hypothetical protein